MAPFQLYYLIKNGFRSLSFDKISIWDSYFIHRYIIIKYRSRSNYDLLLVSYTLLCPHFRVSYSLHNLISLWIFFIIPHSYVRQIRAIYIKRKERQLPLIQKVALSPLDVFCSVSCPQFAIFLVYSIMLML